MDGRRPIGGRRGRTLGALVLLTLLWPLAGQANIPRIPFHELPRADERALPFPPLQRASEHEERKGTSMEVALVPVGAVRVRDEEDDSEH